MGTTVARVPRDSIPDGETGTAAPPQARHLRDVISQSVRFFRRLPEAVRRAGRGRDAWRHRLASALAATGFAPASADMTTYARAGAWEAFGGRTGSNRAVCGITSSSGDRHFYMKHYENDAEITFQVSRSSWNIPQGTRIPIQFEIDGLGTWSGTALGATTGHGGMIQWTLDRKAIRQFEREFRNGTVIRIAFPGGLEPDLRLSLWGAGEIVDQFIRCLRLEQERASGMPARPFRDAGPGPAQPFGGRRR